MTDKKCKVSISKDKQYFFIEAKDLNGELLFEVNLTAEQFANLMVGEDAKAEVIFGEG